MEDNLTAIVQLLRTGGTLLYPTDTVWGLGCDATNATAVKKIYTLKNRSESKAMLVLVKDIDMLRQYVPLTPTMERTLLVPSSRPTTYIYPHAHGLAENLLAEDGSIGIRIVHEPFVEQLLSLLGHPLVSTSANISGEPSPATFAQISEVVKDRVDYVCIYRQNDTVKKVPSKVVKWDNDAQVVLRE